METTSAGEKVKKREERQNFIQKLCVHTVIGQMDKRLKTELRIPFYLSVLAFLYCYNAMHAFKNDTQVYYLHRLFLRSRQLGGLVPVSLLGVPPCIRLDKL